jgi:hypothetical protein
MKFDSGEFHLILWHIPILVKVGETGTLDEDVRAFLLLSRLQSACNSLNIYQCESRLEYTLQRRTKHTSPMQRAISVSLSVREDWRKADSLLRHLITTTQIIPPISFTQFLRSHQKLTFKNWKYKRKNKRNSPKYHAINSCKFLSLLMTALESCTAFSCTFPLSYNIKFSRGLAGLQTTAIAYGGFPHLAKAK